MESNKLLPSKKLNKCDSPKTPGGISKSLLTPCRRLGLSRNWKRGGSSPFVSPLTKTNSSTETKKENEKRNKRRCSTEEMEEIETKPKGYGDHEVCSLSANNIDIKTTPTRILSPRKKCKTLLLTKESKEECEDVSQNTTGVKNEILKISETEMSVKNDTKVSKLSRKNLKNKSESSIESTTHEKPSCSSKLNVPNKVNITESKETSPHNLTKECMVVIQNKIFKSNLNKDKINSHLNLDKNVDKLTSQCLVDSDSDDVPLSSLNKIILEEKDHIYVVKDTQNLTHEENRIDVAEIDDGFINGKKINVKKLEDKTTSTSGLKVKNNNSKKKQVKEIVKCQSKSSSQSWDSCDDDDDFDFDKKKTILIKKTYNKVTKLLKVRSTGSITQRDIDEITARIERKKNMLLVRAMTDETKELRDLIKKWQSGCHNALIELLELMKKKMPEQNMGYSEILGVLKIPPDLVGYDSENDSFNTPDDKDIILSGLKLG